ncbi:MAG: AMP-binding protein [Bacteroidia bacterium]|nr:AMP-binding protein [Bacteroidia bacterium]
MISRQYNELMINGHLLRGDEILQYCRKSNIENMKLLGAFISEWLTDSDTMQVQTSGSTGKPKTISVEKKQMLQSAEATASFFNFKQGQTALLCLPISYIAGKMMVVRTLFSRLNLICVKPDEAPLKSIPENTFIDFAPLTPMQLNDTTNSSMVKTILLGGSAVSSKLESALQQLNAEVYHGYGMTETLSHVALRKVNGKDKSEIYQGLPGVKFNTDDRGCLEISVLYLNKKIITNDIVALRNDHSFIWKGRADNIINSGGIKLFPEMIENRISTLLEEPFFIAGTADHLLGEKLCLFIESENYDTEKLERLKINLKSNLDKYEIPKEIFFIQRFQRTASEKIQRQLTIQDFFRSK